MPATVSRSSSVCSWNTSPIRRRTASGCRATSNPATRTRPPPGRVSVHSIRTVVVFPAPFGPRNANTSPRLIENDTSLTASMAPYRLDRDDTSTAVSAAAPGPSAA